MTNEHQKKEGGLSSLKEGDIYRWRWADAERDAQCGPYESYHCYSQMAVVIDGKLIDTYWHGFNNKVLDPASVSLTVLGNKADLVEIREYDLPYYRREDIVDMRHLNNSRGPIYLRKGASRDAGAMLEVIEHGIESSKREIDFAQRRIERLAEQAAKVRAGKLNEVHL
ncbi:hypothetical protein GN330_22940 [Nitratireductor sp. CAU 1489]|uniref:Uncharacterized protein n=1 Tax=Nitratireductor arenosus TaxID=2682096 RepID=A0A844QJN7_9HYPH|nr:hypothetical protein [Nitratireductor arenosus]MVB00107.1 hypothetical protein [Nitratireductor arenosus]